MSNNQNLLRAATSALAESIGTIVPDLDDDKAGALAETLKQFEDYMSSNDDDGDGERFSQMFSNPKAAQRALACILAARRVSHVSKSATTTEELRAERDANLKSLNPISIAKAIVDDNRAFGISETEMVELIGNHDRRDGETAAKCFSRHFETNAEVRKAIEICKAAEVASLTPIVVDGNINNPDDAREATEALARVVEEQRRTTPWMSAEAAWDAAMKARPDLAARAIPRLEPVSVYPMPR